MLIKASATNVPSTPKKLHLVANAVKHMRPQAAVDLLSLHNKKASATLAKTIKQAIGNAVNNLKLSEKDLVFNQILIGRGMSFKRFHAGARGRAKPYEKTRSNITVELRTIGAPKITKTAAKPKTEAVKESAPAVEVKPVKKSAIKKTVTKKETK